MYQHMIEKIPAFHYDKQMISFSLEMKDLTNPYIQLEYLFYKSTKILLLEISIIYSKFNE